MNERLAHFMKLEGLTAVKFAEIMEVQPSSISHLLSGRNKPNFEFISRILLRFPQLNPDWIINGIGSVYKSKTPTESSNITGVKNELFTDVIQSQELDNLVDSRNVNTNERPLDALNHDDDIDEFEFTNVNNDNGASHEFPSSVPPEPGASNEIPVPATAQKSIARIVLFFSDGTFEDYHK